MATVLVVDDHASWREAVRETLERAGHRVVGEARDGLEALAMAKRLTPTLITLDIQMPLMNGIQCLEALMAQSPATRVVMVTSVGSPTVQQRCRELGAASYVIKPFDPEDLLLAVGEALQ